MNKQHIYLREAWRGYEVRYNVADDCLETRRVQTVEVTTDGSDDGFRAPATYTRLEGVGEWAPAPDLSCDLLEEGRRLADEMAAAERKAAREAMPVLTIEVRDGEVFVDGEVLNVRNLLRAAYEQDEPGVRLRYEGRRLAHPVDAWLGEEWESPRVTAFQNKKGVKLFVGE